MLKHYQTLKSQICKKYQFKPANMSNKKDRKSVWTTLKQPQKQRGNFYNTATTTKQKGRQKYKRMEIISPMFGKQQSQN